MAGRLLRRVRDFASVAGAETVDRVKADAALTRLEVDGLGLDGMDRRYLTCMAQSYGGGPVGVDNLAAALSEPRDAIEDIIEPYLMQLALIVRTPRGRMMTAAAWQHLGLTAPSPPAGHDGGQPSQGGEAHHSGIKQPGIPPLHVYAQGHDGGYDAQVEYRQRQRPAL